MAKVEPGSRVGPYRIDEKIGAGGMGEVFLASDARLSRQVALKLVQPGAAATDTAGGGESSRLLREARSAAQLNHPNVVHIYDVGEDDGTVYVAMELVRGTTLREAIADSEASLHRRLGWLIDVAGALHAAHQAGLVHRDIKPENVMLTEEGHVKVLDFGLAKPFAAAEAPAPISGDEPTAPVEQVTQAGLLIGTPVYMAPELLGGGEPSPASDQFAWGVLAYEVVTGRRPWSTQGDIYALLTAMLSQAPDPARSHCPQLPAAAEDVIHTALERRPEDRFSSMKEASSALGAARETLSTDSEQVALAPTEALPPTKTTARGLAKEAEPTPEKGQRGLFVLGAIVAAVALVVVLVLQRGSDGGSSGASTAVGVAPSSSGFTWALPPQSQNQEARSTFTSALRQWRDGSRDGHVDGVKKAVELDPKLASGHLHLGLWTLSRDPDAALEHFRIAYTQRDALTPRELALLEASRPYVNTESDLDAWGKELDEAARAHPRDPVFAYYRGMASMLHGQYELALRHYDRAIAWDGGFIPARSLKAHVLKLLDRAEEARTVLDACLKQSRAAAQCLEARIRLAKAGGDCKRMEADARQWVSLEPKLPSAHAALAGALLSNGAPLPAARVSLEPSWSLGDAERRPLRKLTGEIDLALLEGDFASALEHAAKLQQQARRPGDLQLAASVRAELHYMLGDKDAAADVAEDFLGKAALSKHPLYGSWVFSFNRYLLRAGRISRDDYETRRGEFIERQREKFPKRKDRIWSQWNPGYAEAAETVAEGKEAQQLLQEHLPLLPLAARGLHSHYLLGKVHVLAGKHQAALEHLRRATATCQLLEYPIKHTRSQYYLGVALQETGNEVEARAAFEVVVNRWGKATPKPELATDAQKRFEALAP